jgi:hypothetical protein
MLLMFYVRKTLPPPHLPSLTQEHLMLLLANSARDTDGMRVLHRKMTDN